MATSRVASSLACTVRWRCVSPARLRATHRSVLVSEVHEHTRVVQSLESLYHFPLATSYTPPRTTLVLARDLVSPPTTAGPGSVGVERDRRRTPARARSSTPRRHGAILGDDPVLTGWGADPACLRAARVLNPPPSRSKVTRAELP